MPTASAVISFVLFILFAPHLIFRKYFSVHFINYQSNVYIGTPAIVRRNVLRIYSI